jgi:hypothetical protein
LSSNELILTSSPLNSLVKGFCFFGFA